jgi:hypothetical protein
MPDARLASLVRLSFRGDQDYWWPGFVICGNQAAPNRAAVSVQATMPNLILELQQSLESLDELLSEREFDQSAAFPILSNLLADVRSVKRKASGDSLAIAKH